MGLIPTSRGEVDDSLLEKTEELVDDATMFGVLVTYRFKDDGAEAGKFVRPIWNDQSFRKVNEFARTVDPNEEIEIEIDGVRSFRRAGEMEHRFGQVDNDQEFTTWEEFWLPGIGVPVHREPHVRLKKSPLAASGGVGTVR